MMDGRQKRINDKLREFCDIEIIDIVGDSYLLSNDRIVKRGLFNARLRKPHYRSHFPILYGTDNAASESLQSRIHHDKCSAGGKRSFDLHGDMMIARGLRAFKKAREDGSCFEHTKHGTWHKGLTKDTHPSLKKLSEDRMGKGNPMYGTTYTDEQRATQSKQMRLAILEGRFTPNPHNSRTHWDVVYNGQKYRSSWEAAYHAIYPIYEYETLRIQDAANTTHIVDFFDPISNHAVEIKPRVHQVKQKKKTRYNPSCFIYDGHIIRTGR